MALVTAALLALRRPQASAHRERPEVGAAGMAFVSAASVIAHPRIDDRIEQIDDQIEDDREHGDHHHRAHHQRIIAVEGGIDEIAADARNLKDRLDDDRAGEKAGGRRSGLGDDR
jgi:hypothetical protein